MPPKRSGDMYACVPTKDAHISYGHTTCTWSYDMCACVPTQDAHTPYRHTATRAYDHMAVAIGMHAHLLWRWQGLITAIT